MQTKSYLNLIRGVTVVAATAVTFSVLFTNPRVLGAVGVTLWFVALVVGLQGVLTLILYMTKHRMELEMGSQARFMSALRQGFLLATGITICLALSSLRQLSLRDVVLIVILGVMVEFYLRTRRK